MSLQQFIAAARAKQRPLKMRPPLPSFRERLNPMSVSSVDHSGPYAVEAPLDTSCAPWACHCCTPQVTPMYPSEGGTGS